MNHMKRSRRVILMVMGKSIGTIAAATLIPAQALARSCDPKSSTPPFDPAPRSKACKTRGGFGTSPRTFNDPAASREYLTAS